MDPAKLVPPPNAPAVTPEAAVTPKEPEQKATSKTDSKPEDSMVRFDGVAVQRICSSIIGIYAPDAPITGVVLPSNTLRQYVDAGAIKVTKAEKVSPS